MIYNEQLLIFITIDPVMRKRSGTVDTKDRLLDAVAKLMRTRGLARLTTRDIAEAAGVAEGTMYNHFRDKSELLIAFLQRAAPATMRETMSDLPLQIGQRTLRENLQSVVGAILTFHRQVAPVICSLLADTALMKAARKELVARGAGPRLSADRLAAYLAAEQKLGRVSPGADVYAAAELLLGASFKIAVEDYLFGTATTAATDSKLARKLAEGIVRGLQSREIEDA